MGPEQSRINSAVVNARAVFWAKIASAFPEVTTGDMAPFTVNTFDRAADAAVREWIENNWPFREYRVRWEIDIEARSEREAAEKAFVTQRDADDALVFGVSLELDGPWTHVDLSEPWECVNPPETVAFTTAERPFHPSPPSNDEVRAELNAIYAAAERGDGPLILAVRQSRRRIRGEA
jgi:hypothetical protein